MNKSFHDDKTRTKATKPVIIGWNLRQKRRIIMAKKNKERNNKKPTPAKTDNPKLAGENRPAT